MMEGILFSKQTLNVGVSPSPDPAGMNAFVSEMQEMQK